jgi:hypothetical protein
MVENISVYQYDPTRTLTLRSTFARKMRSRAKKVQSAIQQSIVDRDCFGLTLTNQQDVDIAGVGQFDFPRNSEKVSAFQEWLKNNMRGVLIDMSNLQNLPELAWTSRYILDAYQRGIKRARTELRRKGYSIPSVEESGDVETIIRNPVHSDSLDNMYQRTINEVENAINNFIGLVGRVLFECLQKNLGPREIMDKINGLFDGENRRELGLTLIIGNFVNFFRRLDMITRTEIVRTINESALSEYKYWEVDQVELLAEWVTAQDDRVCPYCHSMSQGGPYNLSEAAGLIPAHSFCRCFWVPIGPNE